MKNNQLTDVLTELQNKYYQEKQWAAYLQCFPFSSRLPILRKLLATGCLTGAEYWSVLGSVLRFEDDSPERRSEWRNLLTSRKHHRQYIMYSGERRRMLKLSKKLTIYRGFCDSGGLAGCLWTLDEGRAESFAFMTPEGTKAGAINPAIATGWCLKQDILAFFDDKYQQIVILPELVRDIRVESLKGLSRTDLELRRIEREKRSRKKKK